MSVRTCLAVVAVAVVLMPSAGSAQSPVLESLRGLFDVTRTHIQQSAELVDAELYTYRPTPEVRTIGQLFGHVANAQYMFCSAAAGEASPSGLNFEDVATDKAAIVQALIGAFDYCESVMAGMTDADGSQARDFFTGPNTVFGILAFNSAHNYEHYGNLVTYMRMNGIVPPSSR